MSLGLSPFKSFIALRASFVRFCGPPAHSARLIRPSAAGLSSLFCITASSAETKFPFIALQGKVPRSPLVLSAQTFIHGRASRDPPPNPGETVTRSRVQTGFVAPAPIIGHHFQCLYGAADDRLAIRTANCNAIRTTSSLRSRNWPSAPAADSSNRMRTSELDPTS